MADLRKRPRKYARRTNKWKAAQRVEAELAKQKEILAQQEDEKRQIDEAKEAMAALIAANREERKQELLSLRPPSLLEYCEKNNLDPNIQYHPRYNVPGISPEATPVQLEARCFVRGWPSEYGGLGGYGHLKNFIKLVWPWINFNPWFEQTLRALADDEYVTQLGKLKLKFINLTGPGSASKTFAAGVFACAWYAADALCGIPSNASVTLTSTSVGIINQRIWPVIQRCFHESEDGKGGKLTWGHMIDSKKLVVAESASGKKDAQHSICALAVERGDVSKAVDNIKGRHAQRMMLIVDEANSTPEAIFNCIPNMLTSVRELIVVVIGNALSRLDPHGLCCEPVKGWRSITIEDSEWPTKGVEKWGIGPGVCLHYDGAKSPNVLAGRTEYKEIYSYERWIHVERQGEEYRNTLQHWSQDRGFWPPDGLQITVMNEAMVIKHEGTGKFTWTESPKPCAALDPAFGGDQCVLVRGLLGRIHGGKFGLQITDRHLVPFNPDSPDDIQAQIADYVHARCQEWRVEPNYFGLDSTGTGRGVKGFITQLWSPRILAVEFGGNASTLPASTDDPRESCEIYANRVTELWYSAREMLIHGQLRGLYEDAVKDFCARTYRLVSRRYQVETKDEMKKRYGHSPDDGDAVAVLVEVARQNGMVARLSDSRIGSHDDPIGTEDEVLNESFTAANSFEQYAQVVY